MRRAVAVAISLALVGTVARLAAVIPGQAPAPSGHAARFVGTWRLVSIESATPNPNRGPRPTGLIYYDATGHMGVQIMPDRVRPSWTGTPTPEQAKDAIAGFTAYFGTYTVDERAQTVTHHREGSLVPGPVDYVRHYEFAEGDRLILKPVGSSNRLTWQLIR
jgi:hypothetical protein